MLHLAMLLSRQGDFAEAEGLFDDGLAMVRARSSPLGREEYLFFRNEQAALKALAGKHEEALRICDEFAGSIHLLVTDMVMRSMTGQELATFVRRGHPEMRILYMSGYTDRSLQDLGLGESGISFLQKPFSVEDLTLKVRDVLDSRQPTGGARA